MNNLKSEIYELCARLRSLEAWGLSNTSEFKRKQKKVLALSQKLEKAKKFLKKYFDKCSNTHYCKPAKTKSYNKK